MSAPLQGRYELRDLGHMVYLYGFCDGNARAARREFIRRFPGRPQPSSRLFSTLFNRLMTQGTLISRGETSGRPARRVEDAEDILGRIQQDRSLSTRTIASELNLDHTFVWRTLRDEGLHPFHLTPVQELLPRDLQSRVDFCRIVLERDRTDPRFLSNVLWTDESNFTKDGVVNFHNIHRWAESNPHASRQTRSQYRFKLNVWAGIVGHHLVGPYIFRHNLAGDSYLNFLEDVLPELLEDVPLSIIRGMIFQHDGAPPHSTNRVQQWLNENFPNRWIGRGGPIQWPARSPDLTPMDYFLWGFIKQEVYSTVVDTEDTLRQRIEEAFVKLRYRLTDIHIPLSVKRRLQICNLENGRHIENLL